MQSIDVWLQEYGTSHTHPINQTIHKIMVPLISFSVLGLLWLIKIPGLPFGNFALLFSFFSLFFYCRLSYLYGIGMSLQAGFMLWLIADWEMRAFPLLAIFTFIFIVSWIFQFVGHKIEGKKPSFFQDLVFLLIGPLWVLRSVYKQLGIK